ncbi:MAG: site-2 protease family protein [Actinomycetia bacterium]|nr:site-2 protease family protein [Actinomycetes bacterium]
MSANNPSPRPPAQRGRLLPVGRFFGVPLYLAPSWLLIAALITLSYSGIVRDWVDGISPAQSYLIAFGFAVALAACVLAHELGHVAVSLALGRPVRQVVIFLLGGVSEIDEEIDRSRDELLIALAGPAVSLLVAAGAWLGYRSVAAYTVPWALLSLLVISNLIVAVFNLLPGLPLDGGRVLRAIVWRVSGAQLTGTRAAAWVGRALAIVVVVGSSLFLRSSGWGFANVLFGLMLGAFIWVGATGALRSAELSARLPGLDMARLLRPGLMVRADVSVAEALRRAWESRARGLVVVDSADHPRALVNERRIGSVPTDRRPWVSVSEVARPLEPGLVLPLSLRGTALVSAVRATPAAEYLVVREDGSAAGILSTADLAMAMAAR